MNPISETVRSLFLKARSLLDEYSDDGVMIPEADVIDMQQKSIPLCDMAHKELYEQSRLDITKAEPNNLTTINDTTEVNYKADQAIVYYIAARLAPYENKELVPFFESKFEELRRKSSNIAVEEPIIDVYGIIDVSTLTTTDVV